MLWSCEYVLFAESLLHIHSISLLTVKNSRNISCEVPTHKIFYRRNTLSWLLSQLLMFCVNYSSVPPSRHILCMASSFWSSSWPGRHLCFFQTVVSQQQSHESMESGNLLWLHLSSHHLHPQRLVGRLHSPSAPVLPWYASTDATHNLTT